MQSEALHLDEDLIRRLPLPLARLYRRAHNARSDKDRLEIAYYLWEASLKLLASTAIVEYAELSSRDPVLEQRLTSLSRPSLGHWWEFARLLVPALATADVAGYQAIRELLFGRARDDLPRAAGLDALLQKHFEGRFSSRATVKLAELFERLVRYRNKEIGHGAAGQRSEEFYQALGPAMLSGVAAILTRLDVLAGRRLIYVDDVRRAPSGAWLVERSELTGEAARRLGPLTLSEAGATSVPNPGRVYCQAGDDGAALRQMHPLLVYEPQPGETYFLNSCRGKGRVEYLCFTNNAQLERVIAGDRRELLVQALELGAQEAVGASLLPLKAGGEECEEASVAEPTQHQIGDYELISKIGQGGMGEVYRAREPVTGREVALKRPFRTGDERYMTRFLGEIRALGKVKHPNVVRIYSFGTEGDFFYTMELLEGATLSSVCKKLQSSVAKPAEVQLRTWHEALSTVCEENRKQASPASSSSPVSTPSGETAPSAMSGGNYIRQVVDLLRQVAEGAHALHKARIFHRDIKPGNIMVSPRGTHATLMDLGLAKFADEVDRDVTKSRDFVGTYHYASPEQIFKPKSVNERADIYSLGAILWELLTLRPICGDDEEISVEEQKKRILFEEIEPVRKYNPAISRDLEAVVSKCLEKDAALRYSTTKQLAEELGRCLRGEPVIARKRTLFTKLMRGAKQQRDRLALATVWLLAFGVLAAAGIQYWQGANRPTADNSSAVATDDSQLLDERSRVTDEEAVSGILPVPPVKLARRRALIIGPTKLGSLKGYSDSSSALSGPGNDVILVRNTLALQGFADSDMVTLADASPEEFRPTRATIERECKKLATEAQQDDLCVVYYSGEGMLLPGDVQRDENSGQYIGTISSASFTDWMRPCLARDAWLTIVCDAGCGEYGGFATDDQTPVGDRLTDFKRVVCLYAGHPDEPSVEVQLPYDVPTADRRPHGLFTFTLCQALRVASQPQSYEELIRRIQDQYASWGRTSPTPWLTGGARRQIAFGQSQRAGDEARFKLTKSFDGTTGMVNAGSAVGLTTGTIFELKPPAPTAGQSAGRSPGHVRVTRVGEGATVEPIAFAGQPAPLHLPDYAQCEPAFVDYAHLRLTLAVSGTTRLGETLTSEQRNAWTARLKSCIGKQAAIQVADKEDGARWLVVFESLAFKSLFLEPQSRDGRTAGESLGLMKVEDVDSRLPEVAAQIARGQGLLLLAALQSNRRSWCPPKAEVRVEIAGQVDERSSLRVGNEVVFRVTNIGKAAVVSNLFVMDREFRLLPTPFVDSGNQPQTGKVERRLPKITFVGLKPVIGERSQQGPHEQWLKLVNDIAMLPPGTASLSKPFTLEPQFGGQLHVITITGLATLRPASFGFLCLPKLDDLLRKRARLHQDRALATPLGRLLRTLFYGEGNTTGLTTDELADFSMSQFSIRVEAAAKSSTEAPVLPSGNHGR